VFVVLQNYSKIDEFYTRNQRSKAKCSPCRPQFFKTSRPSKAKTKTALAKTKTSKNVLKTKTGLEDYVIGVKPRNKVKPFVESKYFTSK